MAAFMSMLYRIVGMNKRRPVYNDDERVKKPVYKNQPTDITDAELVLKIVDLEDDIKIIKNKFQNCADDPIRQRLLWRMFLETANSLSLLRKQNDYDNSKLLKVMYENVSNPDNIKSGKKLHKRLEKYTNEYNDRNDDVTSHQLSLYEDDSLKSEFMSSTIVNFGLSELETLTNVVVCAKKEEGEKEEGNDEKSTDRLPDLPTSQILIPAMKSSHSTTTTTTTTSGKSVSFSNDTAEI